MTGPRLHSATADTVLWHGDCIEVMRTMPANSIDAIVTDPPYGLPGGFMGKTWDRYDGWEDAGLGYYISGLIDGEGCFTIKQHTRGTHAPCFAMKMRADDRTILERACRYVGAGIVEDTAGSGTTLQAAKLEGFRAVGIEMTPEYLALIEERLAHPRAQGCQEGPCCTNIDPHAPGGSNCR